MRIEDFDFALPRNCDRGFPYEWRDPARLLVHRGRVAMTASLRGLPAWHPARGGPEFAAALREHAVLVRHFNKPRTAPYPRITVGTEDEVRRLIAAAVLIVGHV